MRSFLFAFLFLVVICSFASANEFYQSGVNTSVFMNCDFDGNIPSTSATNNLSVIYMRDGSLIVNNQETTSNGNGLFSYNLSFSNNGFYKVVSVCVDGSKNRTTTDIISVNPNGEEPTSATSIFYIGLLSILIVILLICVYGFISSEQIWTTTIFISGFYLLFIALTFVSWNMAANFMTSAPFLIFFLRLLFFVSTIGLFPFLLGLFAYGSYMAIQIDEIKKLQEQGYSEEEAWSKVKKRRKI